MPCIVRLKLLTLDNQLIVKKIAHLSQDNVTISFAGRKT